MSAPNTRATPVISLESSAAQRRVSSNNKNESTSNKTGELLNVEALRTSVDISSQSVVVLNEAVAGGFAGVGMSAEIESNEASRLVALLLEKLKEFRAGDEGGVEGAASSTSSWNDEVAGKVLAGLANRAVLTWSNSEKDKELAGLLERLHTLPEGPSVWLLGLVEKLGAAGFGKADWERILHAEAGELLSQVDCGKHRAKLLELLSLEVKDEGWDEEMARHLRSALMNPAGLSPKHEKEMKKTLSDLHMLPAGVLWLSILQEKLSSKIESAVLHWETVLSEALLGDAKAKPRGEQAAFTMTLDLADS